MPWRFCSSACRAFFVCQSEPAQHPPHGGTVDGNAVGLGQFCHQFIKRDLAFGRDTRLEPTGHPRQLPMSAAIALPLRSQHPVSRRSFTRSLTNLGDTRKCRAASRCLWPSSTYATPRVRSSMACGLPINSPIPASAKGKHIPGKQEILNLNARDTLWKEQLHLSS